MSNEKGGYFCPCGFQVLREDGNITEAQNKMIKHIDEKHGGPMKETYSCKITMGFKTAQGVDR